MSLNFVPMTLYDNGEEKTVYGLVGPAGPQGETGATGPAGADGQDAEVTSESITDALGYTPADDEDVGSLGDRLDGVDQNLTELTDKCDNATQLLPVENAVVGKILKVKTVNSDGTFTCEWVEDKGATALQSVPVSGNGTTGGIAVDSYLNTQISSGNKLSCVTRAYDRLNQLDNGAFIGKGTLMGIKEDYVKSALTSDTMSLDSVAKAKVCDTIGAKRDKQFELIEDITTTEETNIINRTAEPDGTAYNLSSAIVIVTLPSSNTATGRLLMCMRHSNYGTDMLYSDIRVQSGTNIIHGCSYNNNGLSNSYLNYGTNNSYMTRQGYIPKVWENINRIFVNGITFPVGTNIMIYGIRA